MERLVMNHKERERLEVLSRVKRGELALTKAAGLLQLSYRQGQQESKPRGGCDPKKPAADHPWRRFRRH